jgi:hypothetical protein
MVAGEVRGLRGAQRERHQIEAGPGLGVVHAAPELERALVVPARLGEA